MWIWDAEALRFLAVNAAATHHYGYSQDEFLAMNLEPSLTAQDAPSLSDFAPQSLTGISQAGVFALKKKNGDLVDAEILTQAIDWVGKPAQLIVAQDITERNRVEHALRDSEERVRLILASAAEAIFGCDPVGTCMFCNDAAAHVLGYESGELLGKNMHATEHHTRADGTPYPLEECPIYQSFQDGQGIHRDDEIFWRKDGTSFPVEYWSHLLVQEGKTLCVVTFMDITERKQVEEALRKSEERWRAVFENSAIGVALTGLNGRFIAVNRVYEEMVGYTEEELRKITFLDITHNDDAEHNRDLITDLFEGKRKQFQIEKQYRRKDGSLIWVSNNVSLVPGTESMSQFVMALSEDITERRRAEEALRRSEQWNRTLLEINNAIITNLTRDTLFQSVSETLRQVIDFDRSALAFYEPTTDCLRYVAFTGSPRLFRIGDEVKRANSILGWAFDHQQPIVRGNLEDEQQYPNERKLIDEGMRSHCVAPLIVRGKSIGTLSIASETEFQYSRTDAQLLQEVANQVALAIENMKAYEEIAELKARLEKENVYLQEEIRNEHNFEEIVGNSPALVEVLRQVGTVALTDSTVLILGETGCGKELIARAIHSRSKRKSRPLVKVNCGAIPTGLVESELFGHMRGAFTGALERRIGRFELADGGTLFLDEVSELPLDTQVKLLRVLQEHEFEPLGSSRTVKVNVRIIAASNRDLERAVQEGRFRADLFYRLDVLPVTIPPLRQRHSDIPLLTSFFVERFSRQFAKPITGVEKETMELLSRYSWPGNIRELQNVIERAVVLCPGTVLRLGGDLLPATNQGTGEEDKVRSAGYGGVQGESTTSLEHVERKHILEVLRQTRGVIEGPRGAAKILDLHPNTLRSRMKKLGIDRSLAA
jgi:formate hydrogenlyase transcriptional activator